MIKRITGKTISFESQPDYWDITKIDLKIDGHSASLFEMLELMYSIYHCDSNNINITLHNTANNSDFSDSFNHILH